MKSCFIQLHSALKLLLITALVVLVSDLAGAEVASIYGGRDGLCGHPTANGERLNCAELTAAHRTLAFGARVRVCHSGCVTVRINDRGPWVRGRHIDLSPGSGHRSFPDRERHHELRCPASGQRRPSGVPARPLSNAAFSDAPPCQVVLRAFPV